MSARISKLANTSIDLFKFIAAKTKLNRSFWHSDYMWINGLLKVKLKCSCDLHRVSFYFSFSHSPLYASMDKHCFETDQYYTHRNKR